MPGKTNISELSEEIQALLSAASNKFEEEFSCQPAHSACAPGRVNLIGEHTDYNDGFVLPMVLLLLTIKSATDKISMRAIKIIS